jgi:hypothetical protein
VINKNKEKVVWSQDVDSRGLVRGINVCGSASADPIIGKQIDVVVKHSSDELVLRFDSTFKSDPCFASYGISNLEVYVL